VWVGDRWEAPQPPSYAIAGGIGVRVGYLGRRFRARRRLAIAAIQPGSDRWLVRDIAGVHRVLQERGFVYRDRAGALIMYQSETQHLNVDCGMFSRFYMICEAEKPVLK
jgi:hypothetical protein